MNPPRTTSYAIEKGGFRFEFAAAEVARLKKLPDFETEEEPAVDADGDGHPEGVDCDDADGGISPDADEVCDGVDNNCNGVVDDDISAIIKCHGPTDADARTGCCQAGVFWRIDARNQ